MGRRNSKQKSILHDAFDLFVITPFWVGPIVASIAFVLLRYVAPTFFRAKAGQVDVGIVMRDFLPLLAWIFTGAILMAWIAAEFMKLTRSRMLDRQTGVESIRDLSWKEFEHLVCEAYRRKGYLAEVVGDVSGDGGVDVELRGKGKTILVQCKHWKAYTVGVKVVRELLGVVVDRKATGGILVTSGRFTQDAAAFAKKNSQIELVDGDDLAGLIASVRNSAPATSQSPPSPLPPPALVTSVPLPQAMSGVSVPPCPSCGGAMVMRKAKKGSNAGSEFWGCPRYPACRGTRPV